MSEPISPNKQMGSMADHVRKYREGDLKSVIELYESSMIDCIHLFANKSFFEYFMQFPGVLDDGILVSEADGKITGFEIITITHQRDIKIGSIIVFLAANPQVGKMLLESAEIYCLDQKVDLIMAVPPPHLSKAFDGENWSKFEPSVLIAKGVKLAPLLDALLSRKPDLKKILGDKTIIFSLEDELIQISTRKGRLGAEKLEKETENNPMIVIDKRVLLNIIFGQTNPLFEYVRGKFSVKNKKDLLLILRFLGKMELKDPILTSLADRI